MKRSVAEMVTAAALEVCGDDSWKTMKPFPAYPRQKIGYSYWEKQTRHVQNNIKATKKTVDFWAGEIKKVDGTSSTVYRSLMESSKNLTKAHDGLNPMRKMAKLGFPELRKVPEQKETRRRAA